VATEIPKDVIYRIGRHVLDGASIEWIADRTALPVDSVTEAWHECLIELASALDMPSDDLGRVERSVRQDPESSLRCLLQWQDDYFLREQAAVLSTSADQQELCSEQDPEN
jgi:hypothetical protein